MSSMIELMAEIIKETRTSFLQEYSVPSYYQINNGLCEEFALTIAGKFPAQSMLTEFWTESLENADGSLDWEFLTGKWGILPPSGLSLDELNQVRFGGHCFIHLEGRWFDAECPDGAESPFELPIFRRSIVRALRLKGVVTDDVVTEDVVPPPPCRIPNPVNGVELTEGAPSP